MGNENCCSARDKKESDDALQSTLGSSEDVVSFTPMPRSKFI